MESTKALIVCRTLRNDRNISISQRRCLRWFLQQWRRTGLRSSPQTADDSCQRDSRLASTNVLCNGVLLSKCLVFRVDDKLRGRYHGTNFFLWLNGVVQATIVMIMQRYQSRLRGELVIGSLPRKPQVRVGRTSEGQRDRSRTPRIQLLDLSA